MCGDLLLRVTQHSLDGETSPALKPAGVLLPAFTRAPHREEPSLGPGHLSAGAAEPLWAPGGGGIPEPYLSWVGSS